MADKVLYHRLFESDVRDAAAWYDTQLLGLGDRFVASVRSRVNSIISYPERFSQIDQGLRYCQLPVFPFVVIFEATEDAVVFLSVLHTARSPEKWYERRATNGK